MKQLSIFLILICTFETTFGQAKKPDTLYKNFVSPPTTSYPRVWWHWMNGNITKDGIGKDLKWMNSVGIGGFHNFDAAWATPQIVKKRLVFMTPDWVEAFRYTARLADSLKLEMAISSSPGWSESGGPWVKPKDGMKKIVWSEIYVTGGAPFLGNIVKPPSTTGDFQDLSIAGTWGSTPVPTYYQNIAVIAYKLPKDDTLISVLKPIITSSAGHFDLQQLTDGNIATTNNLPVDTLSKTAWIQFEFEKPQTIKSVTLAGGDRDETVNAGKILETGPALQASNDGVNFQFVCFIPPGNAAEQTISFNPITAKFYRVIFSEKNHFNNTVIKIAELQLHTTTRINRFEGKAGFSVANYLYADPTPATNDTTSISNVIDLANKLTIDGKINWTPPPGNWGIMCFGYSLIGTTNHPASPEATGLEVDKMDSSAVNAYFNNYLKLYENATNGLIGKEGLRYIVTDSWEAGPENWTSNMFAEFKKRRGYDMHPWMPVLTGRIINSSSESERFLWDYRKTLSELVAQYYYDKLTELLHKRGMKRYSESHEVGRAFIADGMDVKRTADIPMSAMWTPSIWAGPSENYRSDVRESASVAHIYGQNLVAAESMTAYGNAWSWSPQKLKPTADLELSCGLNRFVIHTSVHQPTDDKIPGLGLGPFGQWFNRHETWAYQAKPWMAYLSRSSYLLQQGKFVADILYYYGDDNNITSLFRYNLPDIPEGYQYDFINSDALLNLVSVKNDNLVTPSGMRYRILVLDSNSRYMQLKVLKKIKELVKAGAVVVGPKPIAPPGLADNNDEFDHIVDQLWSKTNSKMFTDISVTKVLDKINVEPDFSYIKSDTASKVLYVHRHLSNKDIYWVNNRTDKEQNIQCVFRVIGKTVEVWHPETGKRELSSYDFVNGETKVPLHLLPNDAVFIIFSKHTSIAHVVVTQSKERQLAILKGAWSLSFQKDRGAPLSITVDSLYSWTNSNVDGIKYFSGTATYTKIVSAQTNWFKGKQHIWLDLGKVKDVAELYVNGKSAGIIWNIPFRADITGLLKPGKNSIQIKVTNLWVNRLIGDQQPNVLKKYTYTTEQFYQANSPLLTSGLLGPVTIVAIK